MQGLIGKRLFISQKLSNALIDWSNVDLKFSVMYSMGGFHNSNFWMDNRIKGSLLSCNAWEKELLIYPSSSLFIYSVRFTSLCVSSFEIVLTLFPEQCNRCILFVSLIQLQAVSTGSAKWNFTFKTRPYWLGQTLDIYQFTSILGILPMVTFLT